MSAPSARLTRKIQTDFSDRAADVIAWLTSMTDTSQASERIQTAIIVRANGDYERFLSEMELVELDWRDTLMGSGLEHGDYKEQLDRLLGLSLGT